MFLKNCNLCALCKTRAQVVLGRGNREAKIVAIGEAPGKTEDKFGQPFIGDAGIEFDKWLSKANLDRKEIFVTNTVKCWPPKRNNSNKPTDEEINTCKRWLDKEIKIIKPKIIILFGSTSLEALSNKKGVLNLAGRYVDTVYGIKGYVCLHPAAILYNPLHRRKFFQLAIKFKYDMRGFLNG